MNLSNIFKSSRKNLLCHWPSCARSMPHNKHHKAKNNKGFLSFELGLVLLVIAVAIIGSVLYYRDNLRKTSINNNIQQISSTAANLRAKYGQSNQYGVEQAVVSPAAN